MALAGCTAMLGIDNEYVEEKSARVSTGGTTSATGGAPRGGGIGTGGATAPDGDVNPASGGEITASGGESAASGGTAPVNDAQAPRCIAGTEECGNRMKCCAGTCVPAEPISGCGARECTPCPRPPDTGVAICNAGKCATRCNDGYRLVGDTLETQVCEVIAVNSGGAPGNGGASSGGAAATGGSPPCVADECQATGHRCLNPVQGWLHCCKNDNTCGCTWAPDLFPGGETPYCL